LHPARSTLLPYTTLFRSALGHGLALAAVGGHQLVGQAQVHRAAGLAAGGADDPADRQALLPRLVHLHGHLVGGTADALGADLDRDRKSTRLNSSHVSISY